MLINGVEREKKYKKPDRKHVNAVNWKRDVSDVELDDFDYDPFAWKPTVVKETMNNCLVCCQRITRGAKHKVYKNVCFFCADKIEDLGAWQQDNPSLYLEEWTEQELQYFISLDVQAEQERRKRSGVEG